MVDGVLLVCSSAGRLVDEDFAALLAKVRSSRIEACLAITLGASSMTSVQRTDVAKLAKEQGFKTAVLNDNAVTRGILTAISWFGVDISSFGLGDLDGALDALSLHGVRRIAVTEAAHRIRAEVERDAALERTG